MKGDLYGKIKGLFYRFSREFDSCIIKTVLAGRIKPVLFLSNFLH